MICTGTTIVVLKKENEIVLGADSKVTSYSTDGSPIERPTRCKIKQARNIFYGIAGMSNYSTLDYSVDDNATDSILRTDTIADALKLFKETTRAELRAVVDHMRANNPEGYGRGMVGNQAGIIMAGFENGNPTVASLSIYAKKYRDSFRMYCVNEFVYDIDQPQRIATSIGAGNAIATYAKSHRGFWQDDPIEAARLMLQLQADATPQHVGGPFSIVRITESGAEWIERGCC
jgi:hypothetical protein